MPKKWYQSRIVWANVLAFVIAIATIFGIQADQETINKVTEILTILMPIINGILRLVTTKPVQ